MTFKHTTFNDSVTMRSLARVAQEKGWIAEEKPLTKAAEAKSDLQPSSNLTHNLLKLCSGLKSAGFHQHAEELENSFLQYKHAQALYGVSKEEGEDLVHAAHPEGSHKLENVEGEEATVEDILDMHLKHLQMVDKKPTGKLASSEDILQAVKVVLSQAQPQSDDVDSLYQQAMGALQKFNEVYSNMASRLDKDDNSKYFDILQNILTKGNVYSYPNLEGSLLAALDNFKNDAEPGWFSGSEEKVRWQNEILPALSVAAKFANRFRDAVSTIRKKENAAKTRGVEQQFDPESKPVESKSVPVNPLIDRSNNLINKLKAYTAVGSVSKNRQAANWINQEIGEVQDLIKRVTSVPSGQETAVASALEKELSEKEGEVRAFENQWLPPKA